MTVAELQAELLCAQLEEQNSNNKSSPLLLVRPWIGVFRCGPGVIYCWLLHFLNLSTQFQVMFVLSKPDVFKSSNSDTYVMFGEAKIEDLSTQLHSQAAEQFKAPSPSGIILKGEPSMAAAHDDEEVDETGVDKKDVEFVMTQASVPRSRAVKALKDAGSDIVSAIMELTN
ncbi:nascent polypeptide-associated complex subunit alpha-like protein 1 [Triticum dicoccoides]|uniref:nascent polypeptide-associated complex subunit alpha-like protein 1 n=1 Tax=Triticum dicoccoides TaxID=85692 RepID=UPI00188DE08C|nr:nascent polypeptide-associated complex subunit alpha-like protein 1 [Triticum dicoccoides]